MIINYCLKQYINNPSITELKEDVLGAAKIVIDNKKNRGCVDGEHIN